MSINDPSTKAGDPEEPGRLNLDAPVPVRMLIRNAGKDPVALPRIFHDPLGEGRHSFLRGLNIRLLWAPFISPRFDNYWPGLGSFVPVHRRFETHDADEGPGGPALAPGDVVEAWSADLRDLFEITEQGCYWYYYDFNIPGMGVSQGGSRQVLMTFQVGEPEPVTTVAEYNIRLGGLGGRDAAARLRAVVHDGLATPPADLPGAPPLPGNYPDITQQYFEGSGFGIESGVLMLLAGNSAWFEGLRAHSASSIRKVLEARMRDSTREESERLICAAEAARAGSEPGAGMILDALSGTEFPTVKNAHTALAHLLQDSGNSAPAWLLECAMAALVDNRFSTAPEGTSRENEAGSRLSSLALRDAHLELWLARTRAPQVTPFLIEQAKQSGPRSHFVSALGDTGDPRGIPLLMEMLVRAFRQGEDSSSREDFDWFMRSRKDSDDVESRSSVIRALANLHASEAVPLILQHLEFDDEIEALGMIGDPRAASILDDIIDSDGRIAGARSPKHREPDKRRLTSARIARAAVDPSDRAGRLAKLLRDSSLEEHSKVVVLRRMSDKPGANLVPALLRAIREDESGCVVWWSIDLLGKTKCAEAAEALIKAFSVDFGGKSAFVPARDSSAYRVRIGKALAELTGQDFKEDAGAWEKWWSGHRDAFVPAK